MIQAIARMNDGRKKLMLTRAVTVDAPRKSVRCTMMAIAVPTTDASTLAATPMPMVVRKEPTTPGEASPAQLSSVHSPGRPGAALRRLP